MKNFRERLRKRIEEVGEKNTRLSLCIGTNPTLVKDILEGKSKSPGIEKVAILAEKLGCTVGYLLGETENTNKPLEHLDYDCLLTACTYVEKSYKAMEINPPPEKKAEFIAFEYTNNVKRKANFIQENKGIDQA